MRELYNQIKSLINKVNFNSLWPGFKPYKFAIYNDQHAIIDGEVLEKNQRFIGNTAINYDGEMIAIWKLDYDKEYNLEILTSKIIHEMFHAFQLSNEETRAPNEIKALNYNYSEDNLSIKYLENQILSGLFEQFNERTYIKFLQIRKYRQQHFYNEFNYEMGIEVFEGMAEYIELKALKQLDKSLYIKSVEKLRQVIIDIETLVPIRMVCYHIGALVLLLCDQNEIDFIHQIGDTDHTIFDLISSEVSPIEFNYKINKDIRQKVTSHNQIYEQRIWDVITRSHNKIEGLYKIAALDPLNTVKINNHIYCKHIIGYKEAQGEMDVITKECVLRVDGKLNILEIYY